MRKGAVSIDIDAERGVVFDVIHDYALRLRWDTMLSEAPLLGGAAKAGQGVRSLCVGTWRSAYLPMETEYISFRPGEVAAVRLIARNCLFRRFAATIRHDERSAGSRVTYTYSFQAGPSILAPLIEPLVARMLAHGTHARLVALRDFIERRTEN
jgi:hypothetical protein